MNAGQKACHRLKGRIVFSARIVANPDPHIKAVLLMGDNIKHAIKKEQKFQTVR